MISNVIFAVGFLMVVALIGAVASEQIRIPKVTAYLLVGLAVGPHGCKLLSESHAQSLEPFNDMAMAMVLFNLGCHFSLERFRQLLRRLVPLGAGEHSLCFVLVAIATGLATGSAATGLLLGIMAIATAPATTVLVLEEAQARGPVTDLCGGLVAMNNLVCIVLFELVYMGIRFFGGDVGASLAGQIGALLRTLSLAGILGIGTGLVVAFFAGLLAGKRLVVFLIGAIALTLGASEMFHLPYLLVFLGMGITVVNMSPETKVITRELTQITTLLCVLFFVLHGTHLDINAFLSAGVIGLLYIVTRMFGKYVGTWVVARRRNESDDVQSWLGLSLMSQAGVAIALSASLVSDGYEHGRAIQAIILGSVVFFEVVGPLLVRHAVYQSGEMPLAQAIHHAGTTPGEQFDRMWNRLLVSLGRVPASPQGSVESLITRNTRGIPATYDFDEVIDHIEHSHDSVFPVVNQTGSLAGVIRYEAISDTIFDPDSTNLVYAEDLAEPIGYAVHPTDKLETVVSLFNQVPDDCVVATGNDGRLAGIVRRSDVMNLLVRGHRTHLRNRSETQAGTQQLVPVSGLTTE